MQEIADQLEEHDFKCWIAPRDVRPGRSYGDLIIKGIERAQSFILVLSSASNNSGFVSREIERAVSKNKHIFTVRVEDVQGRRRRSSCSSPRRNGSTPSRGGWRPISTSSRNSLPTMTTSRPRKTGGLRRAPARAGLLGARPMCSEEGPPFLPRSRSARSFSRGRLATSRLSAKHA